MRPEDIGPEWEDHYYHHTPATAQSTCPHCVYNYGAEPSEEITNEDANHLTVKLQRRTPADQLNYLAGQLEEGTNPLAVAIALRVMADEMA
jgi:hypothetical protein